MPPVRLANSMLTAVQVIEAELGIGVVPLFDARQRKARRSTTPPLNDCNIDLWLLIHPKSRHLRRIAAVARHIEQSIRARAGNSFLRLLEVPCQSP